MLKNYLTIAYRNLLKNRAVSIINITGLSLSIAVCILIALYIWHELSYDRFHEKTDQIYRTIMHSQGTAKEYSIASTPFMLAPRLKSTFPEVEHAVRLYPQEGVIKVGDTMFDEDLLFADTDFFNVFSFPLIAGDPQKSLQTPDQVVLTEEMAGKLFGNETPLGKTLSIRIKGKFYDFTVSGVAKTLPGNSSVSFSVLLPMEMWGRVDKGLYRESWGSLTPRTYITLKEQANPEQVQKKLPVLLEDDPEQAKYLGIRLQPITQIHFDQSVQSSLAPASNINYIYILASIGFFILLIAAINFTSLAIGSSTSRASEVGVRKTFGATRAQLSWQFLGESLLMSLFSLVMGGLLAYLLLSPFSNLVGRLLSFDDIWLQFLAVALAITLLTGIAAGSYPAFYLSKFKPASVLKNHLQVKGKNWLIRSLTVVQFTIAVLLGIFTLTMHQQMQLLMTKNLGFDQEQVISVDVPFREGKKLLNLYNTELAGESAVAGVAASWEEMGAGDGVSFQILDLRSGEDSIGGFGMGVNGEFLETMKIKLIAGKSLSDYTGSEEEPTEVLVNEALVKDMGWDDPLGKPLSRMFTFEEATVVGVVEDFHFQSLHKKVEPLALYPAPYLTNLYVKITPNDIPDKLAMLEEKWQKIAPDLPFTYQFLDDTIQAAVPVGKAVGGYCAICFCAGYCGGRAWSVRAFHAGFCQKGERNRHPQSIGSFGKQPPGLTFPRLCQTHPHCHSDCGSGGQLPDY